VYKGDLVSGKRYINLTIISKVILYSSPLTWALEYLQVFAPPWFIILDLVMTSQS